MSGGKCRTDHAAARRARVVCARSPAPFACARLRARHRAGPRAGTRALRPRLRRAPRRLRTPYGGLVVLRALSRERREIPARLHRERVIAARLRRPAREPQRARERDHRAVVGAEREIGIMDVEAALLGGGRQRRAQLPVRAHAAGDDEPLEPRRLQRGERLRDEHVDGRVDEAAREIRLRSFEHGAARVRRFELLHLREHGGLQPAEAEVEIPRMKHRPRQHDRARGAGFREPRYLRPARIAEAEQLRGLVERFAGGIVERLAERLVDADVAHAHQLRMAARHEQRDERKRRRLGDEQRRQQMPFEVVDADGRLVPRERERVRDARADEQRAREAGPLRERDRVDVVAARAACGEHLFEQRQRAANVVARRELGNDTAVFAVHRDLRVKRVREQAALGVVEREAGFVAGAFDAENEHDGVRRPHRRARAHTAGKST
ncbi:hypothetical protein BURPS1710b_A0840 [Burkholderia pseudomallei 1710b]|uniref:Uncharacterized protein n=1 Tax=Burkholderia pseudomallei (strain 1710b) TaxID=320372 RepID=Q3JKA6_BURP1|nr:hypothetical protein BURPS1710b_A0840 [Burkholderia pseudomallei 1710b]